MFIAATGVRLCSCCGHKEPDLLMIRKHDDDDDDDGEHHDATKESQPSGGRRGPASLCAKLIDSRHRSSIKICSHS